MDLINSSATTHTLLKVIAPVTGLMPKTIMKIRQYKKTEHWPDWKKPDELQQMILSRYFDTLRDSGRRALLAQLTDKIAIRHWVAERIGTDTLTHLIATYTDPADIDWDELPVPCVVKTNNGCGTNIIIRRREDIDPARHTALLKRWLTYPYGKLSGQPHYSDIEPAIMVEGFLEQEPGTDSLPYDYKVFCFGGKARFILMNTKRKINGHLTFNHAYDTDWQPIAGAVENPAERAIPRPAALKELINMAERLADGFDFVRVDFYIIGGRPIFGEMTFTPDIIISLTPEFRRRAAAWFPPEK